MDNSLSQYQAGAFAKSSNQVRLEPLPEPKTAREISAKRAADEFEAIFISQLLKSMSVGVKTDGAFGGGPSEDIYRDLMNDELGKSMTGQGGIGMSDSIYREILKNQEVSK